MAKAKITPKDVERITDKLLSDVTAASDQTLQQFADLQQARAQRLTDVHQRLQDSLGEDHPRVKALAAAASAASELRETLKRTAERRAKRPKISAHEWIVFGQVRSAQGEPQQGLRVRVFDRDRKYDDLLGDTYTDEHGDFAVIYHERDFAESGEGLPELYVMVENDQGELLYSSLDQLRFQAGRAEYFDIELSEKKPVVKTKRKKKKTTRKTRTTKRKK